jgi:autoinducer binding domain-containing protein
MSIKELSREELINVLEIIEGTQNCASEKELKSLILRAKDVVSADYAICGLGKINGHMLSEVVNVVNGNYPRGWMETYMNEKLYFGDPIVRYYSRFSLTQYWSDIVKHFDDSFARPAIDCALDHGLKAGISSGIYVPQLESVGVFCFAAEKDRFDDHHKKIVDILALHLNKALVGISWGGLPPELTMDAERYLYGK